MRRVLALLVVVVVAAGCGTGMDGTATTSAATTPDAVELVREHGCTRCHSTTGAEGIGPTWRGLAGSTEQLTDGTTAVADEDYLRRAIIEPGADVVAGYELVEMPTFDLTASEVDALVDYLETLG